MQAHLTLMWVRGEWNFTSSPGPEVTKGGRAPFPEGGESGRDRTPAEWEARKASMSRGEYWGIGDYFVEIRGKFPLRAKHNFGIRFLRQFEKFPFRFFEK